MALAASLPSSTWARKRTVVAAGVGGAPSAGGRAAVGAVPGKAGKVNVVSARQLQPSTILVSAKANGATIS
eukprot:13854199-Alexandrium_andersonii.AAC.1